MLCPKCGQQGFPVRIACLGCNATLPDIPASFENPGNRGHAKNVVCVKCGAKADDARIACEKCDATFPRPFSFTPQEEFEDDPRISYYEFMAEGGCEECAKLNGKRLSFAELGKYPIPYRRCKNPVCWCTIIGVGNAGSPEKGPAQTQPPGRAMNCDICGQRLTLIQNVFSRTRHDYCRETHGYIGLFGLTDWWLSAFSEEERQYIELAYQPMVVSIQVSPGKTNADEDSLLTGARGLQMSTRAGSFLANLAEWLNRPESRHLARRILEHGERVARDPLEKHDVYQVMVTVCYRDREKSAEFLDAAIAACKKQIENGESAIREWRAERAGVVPTHKGYEQLAIIREKEGDLAEALRLSREALSQGWGPRPGWQFRIDRLSKRLARVPRPG